MVTILSLGFIQITLFDLIRTKLRSFKSGDYINGKGNGSYHGIGYLSLFSDPIDLATWSQRLLNFASFNNRVVDTNTSTIQNGAKYIKPIHNFLISQNTFADLKGPKGKYMLTQLNKNI